MFAKSVVASTIEKCKKVRDVFSKQKEELEKCNTILTEEKSKNSKKMDELREENSEIDRQISSNNRSIRKMDDLLN